MSRTSEDRYAYGRRAGLTCLLATLALPLLLGVPPAVADRGADGNFEKRTSSHFVLYQDVDIDESHGLRGSRRFEQDVLETLEDAYDGLDRFLGLRPRRMISVTIYDPAVFDAQFTGLFRFPSAGFYGDSIHVRGTTRVTEGLVRVLHHEVVHAAFDATAPSGEGNLNMDFEKTTDAGVVIELDEIGAGGQSVNRAGALYVTEAVQFNGTFRNTFAARTEFWLLQTITDDFEVEGPGGEVFGGDGRCGTGQENGI